MTRPKARTFSPGRIVGAMVLLAFSFGASAVWLVFGLDLGLGYGDETGSRADWIAAYASCVSALAAIVIGWNAYVFTAEVEAERKSEASRRERLNTESVLAKLRVLTNAARKAQYAKIAFKLLLDPSATSRQLKLSGEDRQSWKAVRVTMKLAIDTVESIAWNDEFIVVLDEPAIDALFHLELAMSSFLAVARASLTTHEGMSESECRAYKIETDQGLIAVGQNANTLGNDAENLILLLNFRKLSLR